MKRLALAAFLVLSSVAMADDITILGPTESIEPGEMVQIQLDGLAVSKLPSARVIFWPRERVNVFPAQTWGGRPVIFFQAKKPDKYLVSVVAGNDYGEIIIQVGDPGPDPPLPPDPPDPPGPDTKFQVAIFHQSDRLDNMSRERIALVSGRKFRDELTSRGHSFVGGFDADALTAYTKQECTARDCPPAPSRPLPSNLGLSPAWWQAIKGHSLPVVAIAPKEGGPIMVFPLPEDTEAMWALLENKGRTWRTLEEASK